MSATSYQGTYTAATILPLLAIGAVTARLNVRRKQSYTGWGFDDYIQPIVLLSFIAECIIALIGASNRAIGYRTPFFDFTKGEAPPASLVLNQKLLFSFNFFHITSLGLTKCAALWLYRRTFVVHKPSAYYYIIWALIVLTGGWMLTFFMVCIFQCGTHFTAIWGGIAPYLLYCKDLSLGFHWSLAITDFLLDTFVLATPLYPIWRLRASTSRKLAITAVFLFACIGYAAAIARLVVVTRLVLELIPVEDFTDVQYINTQLVWFGLLEAGLSLVAVNLPILGKLASQIGQYALSKSDSLRKFSLRSSNSNSKTSNSESFGQSFKRVDSLPGSTTAINRQDGEHETLALSERGAITKTVEYSVV